MTFHWVTIFIFIFASSTKTDAAASLQTLGMANNQFALDLYEEIGKLVEDGGNIFFSPISISTALAMTYAGAKGNTATEMEEVFHFDRFSSTTELHDSFKQLIAAFNEPEKNYTLSLANRLFGRTGYSFLQTFLDVMYDSYNASLKELDFVGNAEGSREYINKWVEDKTEDKIKKLLLPGTIDSSTVLVLVNAIYFKGDWDTPFDPNKTTKGNFYVSEEKVVQTDMMFMEHPTFMYGESEKLDAKILELPYGEGDVSMYFILPNKVEGLSSLESKLDLDSLTSALGALRSSEIDVVQIPKFKLVQATDLKKLLIEMGLVDLFNAAAADLSGITGARDLVVSEVVHKAFVDVNEKGTEAAAATAVIFRETAVLDPITFVANRPFLFLICERSSGSILFLGRHAQPPNGEEKEVGGDPNAATALACSFGIISVLVMMQTILFE